ncbi:MurR/RpiR family transcriptional regulator [Hoeflea sp. TYP-13]|uniref:MurR/RpiR family transcriptional regulator n=1 Tax=Hoeflea sp. TYP-13 TaxID=3230023 RepID=UPI0034C6AC46
MPHEENSLSSQRLVSTIEAMSDDFRRAEKQIAEIVMSRPEEVVRLSLKSLADIAGVSEPSVVRFARKLGCSGYSDFKLRLAQETAIERMYVDAPSKARQSAVGDMTERLARASSHAILQAFEDLDLTALDEAAALIHGSRQVFCFGTGGSSAIMAMEAENRLFRLSVPAQATSDAYRQQMTAAISGPDDTMLVFSVTGRPKSLISCVDTAVERGMRVIAITRQGSPLANRATIVLNVDITDDELYFNQPNCTRYAQLMVLDCLSSQIAVLRGTQSAENLHNIHKRMGALHGVVERQPIGD